MSKLFGRLLTLFLHCAPGIRLLTKLVMEHLESAHYAFLLSGKTLKGSLFRGWRPKSDQPSLVDKYAEKIFLFF
jgi:hypothetical protein